MKQLALIFSFFAFGFISHAQDTTSVLTLDEEPEKVRGAFKSTRVIHAHSIEMLAKGNLDVRILHRFNPVNSGYKTLFGLDNAYMRLGFDYGISNNITIGIGRSTLLKDLDFFAKVRVMQQTKGIKSKPVSIVLVGGYVVTTQDYGATYKPSFTDRSSYYVQGIVGRKFNSTFSAQFSPLLVINGTTLNPTDDNAIVGLGGGLRYKVSKRIALTADYHYAIGELDKSFTNPTSLGIDIETGGHVFQLHFSNAVGMNEKAFLTQTSGDFLKGDIRFGFNLSRMFSVGKKKRW
jgi:hypothetical protein